jgi:hypothetical protein
MSDELVAYMQRVARSDPVAVDRDVSAETGLLR